MLIELFGDKECYTVGEMHKAVDAILDRNENQKPKPSGQFRIADVAQALFGTKEKYTLDECRQAVKRRNMIALQCQARRLGSK